MPWVKEQYEINEENLRNERDRLFLELLDACRPYLRRKKFTPRHECSRLNEVYKECVDLIG